MSAILKRKVLHLNVQFVSPISVSSGEDEWTDSDLLRDYDGTPFISGTSLAGAMRAYLEKEKKDKCLMGYSDNENDGKMSSLFVSDMTFTDKVKTAVRDGVSLNENKTSITGSKFDMEILEAKAKAEFYLELVIREDDDENQIEQELSMIFNGINSGEIRLGSKKTRGFGRFKILSIASQTYEKENYLDYANAYKKETWDKQQNELEEWLKKKEWTPKQVHVQIPLRLKGGISIRQYAAKKGKPDYTQILDHGVPVIPGSSFAGAIRHKAKEILEELNQNGLQFPEKVTDIMNTAFGFVKETNANTSQIIIGETEIKGAKPLTMVRTGVSRFESAVKRGALYKETTYVDGTLILDISVRKDEERLREKWILGLLLLVIKDLQNGLLAVGGETAIGRGIFSENGSILIDGEANKEDEFISNMIQNLERNGGINQ